MSRYSMKGHPFIRFLSLGPKPAAFIEVCRNEGKGVFPWQPFVGEEGCVTRTEIDDRRPFCTIASYQVCTSFIVDQGIVLFIVCLSILRN